MTPISRLVSRRYFKALDQPQPMIEPAQRDGLHCPGQQRSHQGEEQRNSQPDEDKCQYLRHCHRVCQHGAQLHCQRGIQSLCRQQTDNQPQQRGQLLHKPFMKPMIAPKPKAANMMISIIAIKLMYQCDNMLMCQYANGSMSK